MNCNAKKKNFKWIERQFKPRKGKISRKKLATWLVEGESFFFFSGTKKDTHCTFFSPLFYLTRAKVDKETLK